ncbi:uncharacterized protein TNCV_3920701 [Trichonephila clavipes]|nr:uncharacterized protein TNCV_3920701 [Trichonephila clavipes]
MNAIVRKKGSTTNERQSIAYIEHALEALLGPSDIHVVGRQVFLIVLHTEQAILCKRNRFQLLRGAFPDLIHSNNFVHKGCGSPVVKVSNHGRHVMSSIPVPLKTRRVGQRCTLNLSRAETSSRWCGVVVRRGGASSGVVHVT